MNIIHLSHHEGCQRDLAFTCQRLGYKCTFMRFPYGYNISKERANRFWAENRDVLRAADRIVTSDTAPLSRVILENLEDFPGKLVVWVCNRFDYCDMATNDCSFPDAAYYGLIKMATGRKDKVKVVPYTDFEYVYARNWRNIPMDDKTIRPSGANLEEPPKPSIIPPDVDRTTTFFVPPYHNDTHFMNLASHCSGMGLKCYHGRYAGPKDLVNFKGIIHIPYAWSNFALFENWYNGVVYFVPSERFLCELSSRPNFFWSPPFSKEFIRTSEWYLPGHEKLMVFFDSWEELRKKAATDQSSVKTAIKEFMDGHVERTIQQWRITLED